MKQAADVPREGLGVGGESGCVPSVVTGELTVQVARWLCEWSQELHSHSRGVSGPSRRTSQVPIHWLTDIPEDKKQILGTQTCIRATLCILWTSLGSADLECRGWPPSAQSLCTSIVWLFAIRLRNGCSPQRGQGHTTRWRRGSPACFPAGPYKRSYASTIPNGRLMQCLALMSCTGARTLTRTTVSHPQERAQETVFGWQESVRAYSGRGGCT